MKQNILTDKKIFLSIMLFVGIFLILPAFSTATCNPSACSPACGGDDICINKSGTCQCYNDGTWNPDASCNCGNPTVLCKSQ